MKFVITYVERAGGSAAENVASGEAASKLLSNWTPSQAATIHQWVQRCDANGGFAVIETDNGGELFKDLATWTAFSEFHVYPVVDMMDAPALMEQALGIVKSVV